MMKVHKIAASVFGIGYAKGGGTYASIATVLVWFGLQYNLPSPPIVLQAVAIVLITALGIWNGNKVEGDWGKDSSRVVIDEVAGMCLTLVAVPLKLPYMIAGLVLFRFFDIVKPLGIRRMEYFKGGWGVMLDDIVAGVYANILLQLFVDEFPF